MNVVSDGLMFLQMVVWLVAYTVVVALGARLVPDARVPGICLGAAGLLGAIALVLGTATHHGVIWALREGHVTYEVVSPLLTGITLSRAISHVTVLTLLLVAVFSGRGGAGLAGTLPAAPPRLP